MSMTIDGSSGAGRSMAVTGASARMPPQKKMSNLFDKIDTSGSGSISQSQFDQAFQIMKAPAAIKSLGADAIWSQLDPNGTGSVSKADFVSVMKGVMASAHKGGQNLGGGGASTLSSASRSLAALTSSRGNNVNILA